MTPRLKIKRIKHIKGKGPISRLQIRRYLAIHAQLATEVQEMKAGPK